MYKRQDACIVCIGKHVGDDRFADRTPLAVRGLQVHAQTGRGIEFHDATALFFERHILRNFIVLHAIENGLDLPLGTPGAELLDTRYFDEDPDEVMAADDGEDCEDCEEGDSVNDPALDLTLNNGLRSEADFRARAAKAYTAYSGPFKTLSLIHI